MGIKSDNWIKRMAQEFDMIAPFHEDKIRKGVISFGLSSYGYDITLSDEFKIFQAKQAIVDPKNFDIENFKDHKDASCVISPNSYILARSKEYFKIPRNVMVLCFGKSTYARCGVLVNITPLEPAWEGYITIAISNTTPALVKIYANEGIAQIVFFQSDKECASSYKDKKGVYQAQKDITLAKVNRE
ncbi:MAG: dCTP deaminase [Candidatus Omnitrophota bacterium]